MAPKTDAEKTRINVCYSYSILLGLAFNFGINGIDKGQGKDAETVNARLKASKYILAYIYPEKQKNTENVNYPSKTSITPERAGDKDERKIDEYTYKFIEAAGQFKAKATAFNTAATAITNGVILTAGGNVQASITAFKSAATQFKLAAQEFGNKDDADKVAKKFKDYADAESKKFNLIDLPTNAKTFRDNASDLATKAGFGTSNELGFLAKANEFVEKAKAFGSSGTPEDFQQAAQKFKEAGELFGYKQEGQVKQGNDDSAAAKFKEFADALQRDSSLGLPNITTLASRFKAKAGDSQDTTSFKYHATQFHTEAQNVGEGGDSSGNKLI